MSFSLTVGVRKFFGKFLLGKETFEVEQSLPHQQANQEVPSSSVARHGYPLFLSSLHLPQDQQLPWQTLCEQQPRVVHFPGPWLLEGGQQPTGLQGLS